MACPHLLPSLAMIAVMDYANSYFRISVFTVREDDKQMLSRNRARLLRAKGVLALVLKPETVVCPVSPRVGHDCRVLRTLRCALLEAVSLSIPFRAVTKEGFMHAKSLHTI